jgi:hypothetical protein
MVDTGVEAGMNRIANSLKNQSKAVADMNMSVTKIARPMGSPVDVERMKAVDKAVKENAESFKNLAGAYNMLIVAKHVKDGMVAMISPAIELDHAINTLSVSTGEVGANLDRMTKAATRAAIATSFTPTEAIEGVTALRRALGDATAAANAIGPAFILAEASAGKLRPEGAVGIAVDTIRGFGVASKDIKEHLGAVFGAARVSGIGIENMTNALGKLGIAAFKGDQSFKDVLATFSLARTILPNTRMASTDLARAISEMGDPKKIDKIKSLFGVDLRNAAGGLRALPEIMGDLSRSVSGLDSEEARVLMTQVFGEQSGSAINAVLLAMSNGVRDLNGTLRTGTEAFTALNEAMTNGTGMMDRAGEAAKNSLTFQLGRLAEVTKSLAADLGGPLVRGLIGVVSVLSSAIEGVKNLNQEWPKVGRFIKVLIGAPAVIIGITAALMALAGVLRIVKAGIASLAESFKGLVLANPALFALAVTIGLVILAIDQVQARFERLKANTASLKATVDSFKTSLATIPTAFNSASKHALEAAANTSKLIGKFREFLELTAERSKIEMPLLNAKDHAIMAKSVSMLHGIKDLMNPVAYETTANALGLYTKTLDELRSGAAPDVENIKAMVSALEMLEGQLQKKEGTEAFREEIRGMIDEFTKMTDPKVLEKAAFIAGGSKMVETGITDPKEPLTEDLLTSRRLASATPESRSLESANKSIAMVDALMMKTAADARGAADAKAAVMKMLAVNLEIDRKNRATRLLNEAPLGSNRALIPNITVIIGDNAMKVGLRTVKGVDAIDGAAAGFPPGVTGEVGP